MSSVCFTRKTFFLFFEFFWLFLSARYYLAIYEVQVPQESLNLHYKVTVTLKLVQIYVTDKKGNIVKDLDKSDFIIYDNGIQKQITDFEKHAGTEQTDKVQPPPKEEIISTPVPPPKLLNLKYFLFFDFAFNNLQGINKAKQAAQHFIDAEIQPSDELSVFSYSTLKGLTIHEYLSSDHQKVREIIKALDPREIVGRAEDVEEEYIKILAQSERAEQAKQSSGQGNTPAPLKDTFERSVSKNQVRNFIIKITDLSKALRYIPGQKNIVLFSSGIPSSILYGAGATYGDFGDPVLRGLSEEMAKELSAANCAVFAFDTREKETNLFRDDAARFEQRRVDVAKPPTPTDIFRDTRTTGDSSLRRISQATGGIYFGNIDEYRKNLEHVRNMTSSYYVLGYSIDEKWDGKYHQINVEVKRKGCDVHAQPGYFSAKSFKEYSDLEKKLHLIDLALSQNPLTQSFLTFPMSVLFYTAGTKTHFLALSKIPKEAIEKFSGKTVELVSLIFDGKENLVNLNRLEAEFSKYRGMDVFYASSADLAPGSYHCRLVIRDLDTGDAALASTRAAIPKSLNVGLQFFTPLLLIPESNFVYLEGAAANKKQISSWKDVYPYDRARYSPLIGNAPQGTSKIIAVIPYSFFTVSHPIVQITAQLIDSTTEEELPVAISVLNEFHKENLDVQFLEIRLGVLDPGTYRLHFQAEDVATNTVYCTQTAIIINP